MAFSRVKPIDRLYRDCREYDLVLVPDPPLASALNRRLEQAHFGPFAITPRRLAAGRRETAEDRVAFLEVIERTDLSWKEAAYAIGNVLQCWDNTGELEAIIDYDAFDTPETREVLDIMRELDTTSSRLAEYDIVYDSMLRLGEYVDVDAEAIQDLIDAGLLRHDTDHPHRLYSVTPDGRDVLGEAYREGVDYGHGQGDLEESAEHVLGVEVTRRVLEGDVADRWPDVARVVPYYEIDAGRRLDVAGLDGDGDVVVAVEVERLNHDALEAVPSDYDKLADCDPDAAIWVVMNRAGGHRVIERLHDPPDGEPRVPKTYQSTTPLERVSIDTPGLTELVTVTNLRNRLEPER